MMIMSKRDEKLAEIAKGCLGIKTLETRNRDRLDFHDVAVWDIKQALQLAYKFGREEGLQAGQESSIEVAKSLICHYSGCDVFKRVEALLKDEDK